ncbi:MAG TPA: hypothetical protein VHM19_09135 [Polyangiales bacterium]|nr:hypothetical protein [Polyangiales bacterium]
MTRLARTLALLVLVAAGSCKKQQPTESLGELGSVGFSYKRSCFFGCPLGQPLLAGTRETIELTDHGDLAGLHVKSSDDAIASFAVQRACYCARADDKGGRIEIADDATCTSPFEKHCDNTVLVQAGNPGDATLELRDAHAHLLDRASVLVREPARVVFTATYPDRLAPVEASAFTIGAGQNVDVTATFYDDEGRKLLAPEGVHWKTSDAKVADLTAFLLGSGAMLDAGLDVVVQAHAKGKAAVTVATPGFDDSFMVTVE